MRRMRRLEKVVTRRVRISSADALQESVLPDRETILRSVTLAAVLVNQLIAASGRTPLPYTEEEFYQGLSAVVTVVVSLWSWWKNNSFTAKAIRADHARRKEADAEFACAAVRLHLALFGDIITEIMDDNTR